MTDPFDTLGIEPCFNLDLARVEKRHRELSRVLHPDRYQGAPPRERRLSLGKAIEVNEAWRVVRDPIRRAEALLARAGVQPTEGGEPKADPTFLMELMDLREALAGARQSGAPKLVAEMGDSVRARCQAVLETLSAGFRAAGSEPERLRALLPLLGELRYLGRFLDELGAAQEELEESTLRTDAAGGRVSP